MRYVTTINLHKLDGLSGSLSLSGFSVWWTARDEVMMLNSSMKKIEVIDIPHSFEKRIGNLKSDHISTVSSRQDDIVSEIVINNEKSLYASPLLQRRQSLYILKTDIAGQFMELKNLI